MVCSVEDAASRDRVQYAEVVLNGKATAPSLQEPKRVAQEVVVDVVDARDVTRRAKRQHEQEQAGASKQRVLLLLYCFLGIMVSFTLNGVVMENVTTHRVLGELSMTFVFCLFNSLAAVGLSKANKEKPSTMPSKFLVVVGALAFGSTISSLVALRYVTFITRILGKSCKSIPVMLMGLVLGKKYAVKKYVSVVVLSMGVAVFLVGTAHEKQQRTEASHEVDSDHPPEHERTPNMLLGFSLLILSLLFDGATGALEDKYMEQYHIGPFDLMYAVNIYKALFAAVGMVVNGELPDFMAYVIPSLPNLMMMSLTGAFGQAFIFFTISKFGALTTAIIGTCRKVLSIVLSVLLFGHILSMEQTVGLVVAFGGIGLNWVNMKNCFAKKPVETASDEGADSPEAKEGLLESSNDTADSDSDDQETLLAVQGELEAMKQRDAELKDAETARGLELVNAWHRQTQHEAEQQVAVLAKEEEEEKEEEQVASAADVVARAV